MAHSCFQPIPYFMILTNLYEISNIMRVQAHLISVLEGVGAPQMTLQQYLSILPCLPLPSGNLQAPFPSMLLSFHLFFCLPLLLAPFTVPCRIVFAMPEDLEMWPYSLSFRFFTMVRRLSCTPIAFWVLLRTSSVVTCRRLSCTPIALWILLRTSSFVAEVQHFVERHFV